MTTKVLSTSESECTESDIIADDFDITPEINFISVNKQFKIILITETLIAIFSLFFIYPPIFK